MLCQGKLSCLPPFPRHCPSISSALYWQANTMDFAFFRIPMNLISAFFCRWVLHILLLILGCTAYAASPAAFSSGIPGPGLWPRLAGSGLILCTIFLPLREKTSIRKSSSLPSSAGGIILAGLLWILLLPLAGYLTATTLSSITACRREGCSWKETVLLTLCLCLFLCIGIDRLLHYSLPQGMLFSLIARG